ncbi:MAG: hypothetical protein ACI4TM_08015 [Candidatus Cryptobacteroides sp.]
MNRMTRITAILLVLLLAAGINSDARNRSGKHKAAADSLAASLDSLSLEAALDTLDYKKSTMINDYSMIGVHYGYGMNRTSFNPKMKQKYIYCPYNFGVTYTRYGKMFNYMPYFGIQAGLFFLQEGYQLDEDYVIENADRAIYNVLEVPVLAHMHYDFWKMKLMLNAGFYGAYRMSIERSGQYVSDDMVHKFTETDRRFDYGLKFAGGFGLVFDPVEIHFMVTYKWGMGTLYDPDYRSQYYYRYAYANNLLFSVGLHFQLTKRVGKTTHQLKKEAKRLVMEEFNTEKTK